MTTQLILGILIGYSVAVAVLILSLVLSPSAPGTIIALLKLWFFCGRERRAAITLQQGKSRYALCFGNRDKLSELIGTSVITNRVYGDMMFNAVLHAKQLADKMEKEQTNETNNEL